MGISGAGKDYIASHLMSQFDYHRFSFSDQLKKLATLIYPWLDADYLPLVKEKPLNLVLSTGEIVSKSPREIWLNLNCLRNVENKIFIRMLQEEISVSSNLNKNILISDIRSEDEFLWCKSNGFTVIHIKASKRVYKSYEIDSKISEMASKADLVFENHYNGVEEFDRFYKTTELYDSSLTTVTEL